MAKSTLPLTPEPKSRSFKRLLKTFFLPQWKWFAVGTVFAVITSLAASSYGLLIKYVGDSLQASVAEAAEARAALDAAAIAELSPNVPSWVWIAVGGIASAAVIRAVSLYIMTIINNTGVQNALVDIQDEQFSALTDGDFARLSADASGGFVSRFINDVNALRDAGLRLANNFTKGVVTVIAALAGLLYMDWQLTLILLVLYPIAFGPVIALGNRVRGRAKKAQRQVGEVTSLLSEGFQSARIVKAYGLEDYQKERAGKGFIERSRLFLKVLKDKAAVDPILEIAGGFAIAGVMGFSAWRIMQGASTLGDLLGVIALIGIAAPELRALGTLNAVVQEGGAAADRVYDVLDAAPRVADVPGAEALEVSAAEITFDNVTFTYPDGSPALHGLSFTARPGETVALVGPSGAGKSTVFNLLLRLYDARTGTAAINGQDVRDVTAQSLRAAMALVAQDAALFDDSVKANIALGRIGASDDEIIAAAKAAHAHDFIMDLPGGYDAPAGEMGRALSGGQRQRIALARAILRGAPILLLDEATSALDAESEAKVQAALKAFIDGRTTLVIAHRLSTVRAADKIVVIEAGKAIEQGTHDELMAAGGAYARLAKLQLS